MLDFYEELKSLIIRLNENQVDYALCSAFEMALYGGPQASMVAEFLVPDRSLDTFMNAVNEVGFHEVASPKTFTGSTTPRIRMKKSEPQGGDLLLLDLLQVTPEMEWVWQTREEEEEWENGRVPVVSRAGFLALRALQKGGPPLTEAPVGEREPIFVSVPLPTHAESFLQDVHLPGEHLPSQVGL